MPPAPQPPLRQGRSSPPAAAFCAPVSRFFPLPVAHLSLSKAPVKIPLQWRYPSLTAGESPTRFRRSVERVAQSVEHLTFNQVVAGSIPAPLTTLSRRNLDRK